MYLEEKREYDDSDSEIETLHPSKRGRKVLLGEKLDGMVRLYITKMRERGGVVNTSLVKAGARGILLSQDKFMLAEFGGPATLTTAWENRYCMRRMNFRQRRGIMKTKVSVNELTA